jgi:hypothetical protein
MNDIALFREPLRRAPGPVGKHAKAVAEDRVEQNRSAVVSSENISILHSRL